MDKTIYTPEEEVLLGEICVDVVADSPIGFEIDFEREDAWLKRLFRDKEFLKLPYNVLAIGEVLLSAKKHKWSYKRALRDDKYLEFVEDFVKSEVEKNELILKVSNKFFDEIGGNVKKIKSTVQMFPPLYYLQKGNGREMREAYLLSKIKYFRGDTEKSDAAALVDNQGRELSMQLYDDFYERFTADRNRKFLNDFFRE